MTRYLMTALALLALSACADDRKDYDASAKCQALGYKPGTAEYDKCIKEEKTIKLMDQQRREFEDMKQQQEDWRQRRY